MSVEENKQIVRRVFEDSFNRGDLRAIDAAVPGASLDHQHPDEPSFRDHLKEVVLTMRAAFPDLRFEISEMIGEGDWVALHSVMTGTHLGPITWPLLPERGTPPVPPTGRTVRVPHMHLIRLGGTDGELWHVMDTLTLLGQLGLMPQRETAPATAA